MNYTTEDLEEIIEKITRSCSLTRKEREIVDKIHKGARGRGVECIAFDYVAKKESQELQPDVEESVYYLLPSGKVREVRTLTLSEGEIKDAFGKVRR